MANLGSVFPFISKPCWKSFSFIRLINIFTHFIHEAICAYSIIDFMRFISWSYFPCLFRENELGQFCSLSAQTAVASSGSFSCCLFRHSDVHRQLNHFIIHFIRSRVAGGLEPIPVHSGQGPSTLVHTLTLRATCRASLDCERKPESSLRYDRL